MTPMLEFDLPIVQSETKPERRDAAENRQLILCTASKLFAEQGVQQVCMSDIAKAAGVGKGTLYRRFANKADLCLALLDSELKQFQNDVLESFRQQVEKGQSIKQRLNWFIDQAVRFTHSHLGLMVEISEIGTDKAVQDVNVPHFWMEMTVRSHLEKMAEQGEFPADIDLNYFTSALLAPLDARIMKGHLQNQAYSVSQISSGLQSLINSICKK